jgi:hypothetical protein
MIVAPEGGRNRSADGSPTAIFVESSARPLFIEPLVRVCYLRVTDTSGETWLRLILRPAKPAVEGASQLLEAPIGPW